MNAPPPSRQRGLGNRIAPPRFIGFLILLIAAYLVLTEWLRWSDWQQAVTIAFDIAAACFLLSLVPLLRDSRIEDMRRHASENDANRVLVLIVTSLLTLVAMAAISGELRLAKTGDAIAIATLIATLALIWLFANMVYALHYAHAYYTRDPAGDADSGGLSFPGDTAPDYADFAYFSCTLGMTFQTSDVEITSPAMRRIALLHGFAAFVFNIGVIAFSINALGGNG